MGGKVKKGPILDPARCRCCGALKKCRILNVEYDHLGQTEVYADILMDCFGLLLCNMDGEEVERGVCATCVVRLRDAASFRRQVLSCEELLLERIHCRKDDIPVKVEVKIEDLAAADSDDDRDADAGMSQDESEPQATRPEPKQNKKVLKKKSAVVKKEDIQKMKKYESMLQMKLKGPGPRRDPQKKSPPTKKEEPKRSMSEDRMLHSNQVEVVENSYVCPFRNRISNYYCYYCKTIFTDPSELRQHTLTHNTRYFEASMESKRIPKIDITRIDCRLCEQKIDDIEVLKEHLVKMHKKVIYPVKGEFIKFKLSSENMACLECGLKHTFIDKLIEHMIDHFGKYVCDTCGSCFIEEASLLQHIRRHAKVDADFPCEICGKNLKSNYSRSLHIATVHEKRPVVPCYKCDASFLSYAQRNRHLINVHGDRRKFPCGQCDKVFDVRKTMMEHVRKYHLQGCRHYCDVCDQRFFTPSELKEHKTSHTGEKNYRCDFCDKSYPRRQSLLEHIRSHTRRYKCEMCSSTFTQNASLKNHIKTHHQGFGLEEGFMHM